MKKNVFILLLLAVCFVSCEFKHPEVIVGTNTLTVGEETFIEVKHSRVRDITFTYSTSCKRFYLYFERPY